MQLTDGRGYVVESSANLRSCASIEQITIMRDGDLLAFHRKWIDELLRAKGMTQEETNATRAPRRAGPPEMGRRFWRTLDGRGEHLDAGTLDVLACYCSAWSQWLAAEAQVKTLGLVVKSPAGFAGKPVPIRGEESTDGVETLGRCADSDAEIKEGRPRSTSPSTKAAAATTPNPLTKLRLAR